LEPDTLKNTKNEGRPDHREALPAEAVATHGRIGPHAARSPQEHREPGQDTGDKDGNKIPPRTFAMRFAGQKAREVFVNKKEIEEFAVAQGHGDEPRRGDRQENK